MPAYSLNMLSHHTISNNSKIFMPHYFQTFMNGLVSFDRLTYPKVTHAFVPLAVLKLKPISFLNNFSLKTIFNILNSNSLLFSLLTSIVNSMLYIHSVKAMDVPNVFSLNTFSPIVVMVLIGLRLNLRSAGYKPILKDFIVV